MRLHSITFKRPLLAEIASPDPGKFATWLEDLFPEGGVAETTWWSDTVTFRRKGRDMKKTKGKGGKKKGGGY